VAPGDSGLRARCELSLFGNRTTSAQIIKNISMLLLLTLTNVVGHGTVRAKDRREGLRQASGFRRRLGVRESNLVTDNLK